MEYHATLKRPCSFPRAAGDIGPALSLPKGSGLPNAEQLRDDSHPALNAISPFR